MNKLSSIKLIIHQSKGLNKQILTFVFWIAALTAMTGQEWERSDLTLYDTFESFEHVLNQKTDTTYIVNFWATWCAPCIKELPYFEALNEVYKDQKVKVVLVSLDFDKYIDKSLIPFLNKRKIKSEVVVLLDGKTSKWIDKVDPRWSGAIPITIFYNKEEKLFFERQFHATKELTDIINPLLK